ncbi:MAG: hypothetical protein IJ218_07240 [Alphaproteobacteria bacterium]|nr:hypothetical protein [Alphaproteobacteria bacterium]
MMRKKLLIALVVAIVIGLSVEQMLRSKSPQLKISETSVSKSDTTQDVAQLSADGDADARRFTGKINMKQWQYNESDKVYYQLGIPYCGNPKDADLAKMAIFVPEKFLNCTANAAQKTYSCKPNNAALVNFFTIHTAPIVLPIETVDYQKIPALTKYQNVSDYTNAGAVYVHIGSRGIEAPAPAMVADYKAAIRFLRYNKANIPANTDLIFTFGVGAGGTISSILGASGDSPLYLQYLENIGAIMSVGDSVRGVMTWYPTVDFASENAAYEWGIGFARKGISRAEHQLSVALARDYVNYINNAGMLNKRRQPMFLQYSEKGTYLAGPYYDFVQSTIEDALTVFLRKTPFPYTPPRRKYVFGKGYVDSVAELNLQGTFLTVRQYVKALNEKRPWVKYDYNERFATIRSVEDFVFSFKPVTQNIAFFDNPERNTIANKLFKTEEHLGLHFDEMLAKAMQNTPTAKNYAQDLITQDALGVVLRNRRDMYSALYYLMPSSKGYGTSKVAPYWRIRGGFLQSENSMTDEINLYLLLIGRQGVRYVDFEMFWAQEQTDLNTDNTVSPKTVIQMLQKTLQSERGVL